ncbi:MAG: 1,4-alpha-glucan branching protein GlgB [Clostridia bacterium]|nr:1,4-alpha-glucan branching protein GlgB [Clostridia bacterium]
MSVVLTKEEAYLFGTGKYYHSYLKFGAHLSEEDGRKGVRFTVWVPGVKTVCVVGDFNGWVFGRTNMRPQEGGIWSIFVPFVQERAVYKYGIETYDGKQFLKADPYAFMAQERPETASVVFDTNWFDWQDREWMERRMKEGFRNQPTNIYEVHLGAWKVNFDGSFYSYTELAETMVPYVKDMGYTYVEMMPVMEHPLDASWGYQTTGYFAPTSRYGDPKGFMYLVDRFHQEGIGVILDWVPSHFCRDAHGLGRFNGEKLYESGDHIQWGTYKFDYARPQVRSFLISSALYWLDVYHADGIRVDGVSSMLYLNFCGDRPDARNSEGGLDDLDAVAFIKEFNRAVRRFHPDVFTVAEEASAYPRVTGDPDKDSLGFTFKWNMGWMNDTLKYMKTDSVFRKYDHNLITFSMMYNYDENFILPLSHDEVVHGKLSLIGRMPGDYWQQFAGMRLLMLYFMTHPGGKLSFMGTEIGQFIEWREYEELEWFLLGYEAHGRFKGYIYKLNHFYLERDELFSLDDSPEGFRWIDGSNSEQSIIVFERIGKSGKRMTVILNFTPVPHEGYRIGAEKGTYKEIFNSDSAEFGGSGKTNDSPLVSEEEPWQGRPCYIEVTVPPLGGAVFEYSDDDEI